MPAARTHRTNRTALTSARTTKPQHERVGPNGWLSLRQLATPLDKHTLLTTHAEWSGPIKLESEHGRVFQHWTACVRSAIGLEASGECDDEARAGEQQLLSDLRPLAMNPFQTALAHWEPPDAAQLVQWLADAGHDAQIDDAGNLRLVVKRRACDGQIKVERRTGRLRFVLPLGSWAELSAESLAAMWELADEANSRTRLARVAWFDEARKTRCEGQVDLTGLPVPQADHSERAEFWRSMMGLAVDGLEVLLRRLGLELDVLADERQQPTRELMQSARMVRV
jgi:hypothetical protein